MRRPPLRKLRPRRSSQGSKGISSRCMLRALNKSFVKRLFYMVF